MHLIKPERNIEIPMNLRIRGITKIVRRDMRSGEVDLVRKETPKWYHLPVHRPRTQSRSTRM